MWREECLDENKNLLSRWSVEGTTLTIKSNICLGEVESKYFIASSATSVSFFFFFFFRCLSLSSSLRHEWINWPCEDTHVTQRVIFLDGSDRVFCKSRRSTVINDARKYFILFAKVTMIHVHHRYEEKVFSSLLLLLSFFFSLEGSFA